MNSKNNIPQLRFPGFTDEWEEKKLGELVDLCYGTRVVKLNDGGSIYPVYGGGGATFKMDTFNREDCVVVSRFAMSQTCTRRVKGKFFLNDSGLTLNAHDELLQSYLDWAIIALNDDIYRTAEGMAQKNLNVNLFKALSVIYPRTQKEQHKIASCISELDNLISAQNEKVDVLKDKKNGLMQQLFPKQGEIRPRLRFPGFTEDWEVKKLSDVLNERREVSVITDDLPQLSFTIADGVIWPEDRKTNQRDFLMTDKKSKKFAVTRLNDIIYNPANVVYGAIHKNNLCDGVVSPIYKIFWTKENANFLNYLVRRPEFISSLASRAEGTVTKLKTLKSDAFLDISVPFPANPEEQSKIADFLLLLDSLIVSESLKLEALKNHMKGLMQQMFPQPNK